MPSPGGLPALLKQLRADRGVTQAELAAKAGLSTGMVTNIETGNRLPSADTLSAIADALNASRAERAQLEDARRRAKVGRPGASTPLPAQGGTISGLSPEEQEMLEGVLAAWRQAHG